MMTAEEIHQQQAEAAFRYLAMKTSGEYPTCITCGLGVMECPLWKDDEGWHCSTCKEMPQD